MKYGNADHVGVLFIVFAIMFLIAILFGNRRREHMSLSTASIWDATRVAVEAEASKFYNFDLNQFRKDVAVQNDFFTVEADYLASLGKAIGVPLDAPVPSQVTNTDKLFDEKIRLLTADQATMSGQVVKGTSDLAGVESYNLAITAIKYLAKVYMLKLLEAQTAITPKTTASKVSNIIS
jgi:hypothetical protein